MGGIFTAMAIFVAAFLGTVSLFPCDGSLLRGKRLVRPALPIHVHLSLLGILSRMEPNHHGDHSPRFAKYTRRHARMLCHVNVVRAWLFLCLVVLCRNGILGIVVVVSPVHTRTLLQKVFGRLVLHAWHVRYFARMYVANLHRLGTSSSLAALLNPELYKARIYILEQFHKRRQDGGALQHQYGIRRLCTVVCF